MWTFDSIVMSLQHQIYQQVRDEAVILLSDIRHDIT